MRYIVRRDDTDDDLFCVVDMTDEVDKGSTDVCQSRDLEHANLIAQALNAHDPLRCALLVLLDGLDANSDPELSGYTEIQWDDAIDKARAVLDEAERKE